MSRDMSDALPPKCQLKKKSEKCQLKKKNLKSANLKKKKSEKCQLKKKKIVVCNS